MTLDEWIVLGEIGISSKTMWAALKLNLSEEDKVRKPIGNRALFVGDCCYLNEQVVSVVENCGEGKEEVMVANPFSTFEIAEDKEITNMANGEAVSLFIRSNLSKEEPTEPVTIKVKVNDFKHD